MLTSYYQNIINIHTPIWVCCIGRFETDLKQYKPYEIQLYKHGNLTLLSNTFQMRYNWYGIKINQYIFSTVGRIILNNLIK